MATYIVGDIQGCFSGLSRLLKKVDFTPKKDCLIAVGDLIGRGPQPLETLNYLHGLGDSFKTVLGNHDLHLLAIYAKIRKAKKSDNLDTLINSPTFSQHINWLRAQPLALMADKNTLVCHAGLYPKWSVNKAIKASSEVSAHLQADHWQTFVSQMYGDQPSIWSKTLTGADRTRFMINALTRMRYIQGTNQLNFDCKTTPELAPSHLTPWFCVTNDKLKSQQRIVFGHWASLNGHTASEQFIALDTGYVWGQKMTALELNSGQIYSVKYKDLKG